MARETGFGPKSWSAEMALLDDAISALREALEKVEVAAQDVNDREERRHGAALLLPHSHYLLTLVVNLKSG